MPLGNPAGYLTKAAMWAGRYGKKGAADMALMKRALGNDAGSIYGLPGAGFAQASGAALSIRRRGRDLGRKQWLKRLNHLILDVG